MKEMLYYMQIILESFKHECIFLKCTENVTLFIFFKNRKILDKS